MTVTHAAEPEPATGSGRLLVAGAVGAAVALALGIYANAHSPASDLSITLGFTDTITMKVWLATFASLFAFVAAAVGTVDLWAAPARRRAAVDRQRAPDFRPAGVPDQPAGGLPLPVPARVSRHQSPRVLAHSLFGCLFYGAFAAKVLVVRSHSLPGSRCRWRAAWCSRSSSASG